MKRGDIASVVAIEEASFEYPWKATNFLDRILTKCQVSLVAEDETGEIIAYIIYAKAKMSSETGWKPYAEIINFAVAPLARKQGVGTQIIRELVKRLAHKRFQGLFMIVREKNLVAQVFFRANDLHVEYTAPNYYEEITEDGYMMMRHFTEA